MHDRLRARLRSILDAVTSMTRLLSLLGFRRTPDPPAEPVHRSMPEVTPAEEDGEPHEQQGHVEQDEVEHRHRTR